ncbi:MAG: haloalkane dehalogenase [Nitriliruptoraceae bacterium]
MVEVHRTPSERFEGLVPAAVDVGRRQVEVDGTQLELAHMEAGPSDAHPVVLLHGEPTYSYLWREVIPPLVEAGLRVVAPDLVGFGRSDKPTDPAWYSHDRLGAALAAHLDAVVPGPLTLVVHDWGGLLGLPWAVEHAERVERLVLTDTGLYTSGGFPSEAWARFKRFVERTEDLPISFLVDGGVTRELTEEEKAAYDAPFDTIASKAGARALPLLVPLADDDDGAQRLLATRRELAEWHTPTLVLWGAADTILPTHMGQRFAELIPGCVGFEPIEGAHHFLQEDAGPQLGQRIARFVAEVEPHER